MSTLTFFREPRLNGLSRNLNRPNHRRGSLFDSLLEDLISFPRGTITDFFAEQAYPTTKVNNLEDRFEVRMVAPGLSKEDLNVSLDGKTLTVSYEGTTNEDDNAVSYSSFTKSWEVPPDTTEKDIEAVYESGILTLNITKKEPKKLAAKTISVK